MRRAGLVLVAAALSFLTVPAWANHSVPTGVNCSSFAYQEDAQAYFEQHPGDPEGLDGPPGPTSSGAPGVACEDLPRRGTVTTTTTTSAPSTTTIPPTTTTVPTVTRTPAVEPPRAILSASSGQVAGDLGDFCWPQPDGLTLCRVVDFVPGQGPNPAQALTVTQGEVATLSFEAAPALAGLRISSGPNATLSAPVANPSRFTMDLPPGTHVIGVNATFEGANARATYYFKLQVVQALAPPAEPSTGRLLALTG
jgi:hypothetical protein